MGGRDWRGMGLVALVALAACDGGTGPEGGALFKVEVSGEHFLIQVEGAKQIEALETRRKSGTLGVISGRIVAGDGGFNAPWAWHMTPESVHTADVAIEVCDGRPSMVQADLAYWLGTVKQFCPWGAKVVQRVR